MILIDGLYNTELNNIFLLLQPSIRFKLEQLFSISRALMLIFIYFLT